LMVQDKQDATNGEAESPPAEYVVDVEHAELHGRDLAMLISGRRCYEDRQTDDEVPTTPRGLQRLIKRISDHCRQTSDYLLPDTPIKEAVFRVMLSSGNAPVTPERVSETLAEQWAMTPYPRDISPAVIQKLMDHSESYCIVRVPGPEPEVEEPEPQAEPPVDTSAEVAAETPQEAPSEAVAAEDPEKTQEASE
jgi:hypothetical protein